MKIAIIGTRGIPAKYGGFETFAQELSLRLVKQGMSVIVYCDNQENKQEIYNGVTLKYINCTKTQNPLKYYRMSIKNAEKEDVDILLICGLGGALFMFEKFLGSRKIYITNTDGVEHLRDKYGFLKKKFIYLSEKIGLHYSDYIIADSVGIKQYLLKNYPWKEERICKIEYGASVVENVDFDYLKEYSLERKKYFLIVSRLEPENNVSMIIDGYLNSSTQKPLVVVGNLNDTFYVKSLLMKKTNQIYFIGGVYDQFKLSALRMGCSAYLHGHSVGGTNPSLLEALGCGNIVIAHDNIYNRDVTNNSMFYFNTIEECSSQINIIDNLNDNEVINYRNEAINRINDYYNWDRITAEYLHLFKNVLSKKI